MVGNGWKQQEWLEVAGNSWKWLELSLNGWKWKDGWKWLKIDLSDYDDAGESNGMALSKY